MIATPLFAQDTEEKLGIAVLPFSNITDDATQDFLSQRVQQSIIKELQYVSDFHLPEQGKITDVFNALDYDLESVITEAEKGIDFMLSSGASVIVTGEFRFDPESDDENAALFDITVKSLSQNKIIDEFSLPASLDGDDIFDTIDAIAAQVKKMLEEKYLVENNKMLKEELENARKISLERIKATLEHVPVCEGIPDPDELYSQGEMLIDSERKEFFGGKFFEKTPTKLWGLFLCGAQSDLAIRVVVRSIYPGNYRGNYWTFEVAVAAQDDQGKNYYSYEAGGMASLLIANLSQNWFDVDLFAKLIHPSTGESITLQTQRGFRGSVSGAKIEIETDEDAEPIKDDKQTEPVIEQPKPKPMNVRSPKILAFTFMGLGASSLAFSAAAIPLAYYYRDEGINVKNNFSSEWNDTANHLRKLSIIWWSIGYSSVALGATFGIISGVMFAKYAKAKKHNLQISAIPRSDGLQLSVRFRF
jgi:hypothetical protein